MSDLVVTSVAESATGSASERSGAMRRDEPAAYPPAATATTTPALRKGGDGNHQRHGKEPDEPSHLHPPSFRNVHCGWSAARPPR